MGFKLDDIYTEPIYPKKGIFAGLVVDENYVRERRIWKNSYHYSYWENGPYIALNEIGHCLNEEKPCEVAIANLSLLFWMFKGPNFNYGGFKEIRRDDISLAWMCQKYSLRRLIEIADDIRTRLEEYQDFLLPKLRELYPSKYDNVEVIYYKLLLLIYDLVLDSFVCDIKGDVWTTSDGYSVSSDGYGKYSVKEREIWHNTTRLEVSHSSELFSANKFKAYMQGRKIIAENVKRVDSTYPADNNTWLYFKTDINELRNNIYPIYEVALADQTLEEKRLNVKYISKLKKVLSLILKLNFSITAMFFPLKHIRDFVEDEQKYKVGKLRPEEKAYRQTIYLNKQ